MLSVVAGLAVALPFLGVDFAPPVDLPQQVSQIRLLVEWFRGSSGLRIQWLSPNGLGHLLLGAGWALGSPLAAGRLAMLAIGLLWAGSLQLAAARWKRPPEAALLATLFFFSHVVYWGFYSFALGFPVFLLFVLAAEQVPRDRVSLGRLTLLLGLSYLLYASHALWFAAGLAWLAVDGLRGRISRRALAGRLAAILPVATLCAFWFPSLARSGFTSPTSWGPNPAARLRPQELADAALGGLRTGAEEILLAALALWLIVGLLQRRKDRGRPLHPAAGMLALAFLVLAVALPERYSNTIRFAQRWMPCAAAMTLLALPAPGLRPALRRFFAVGLAAAFSLQTAWAWRLVQDTELSGLEETLAALPEGTRVVGLDFATSELLKSPKPFLQQFAYAQAVRGSTLNFSFGDMPTSMVVYDPPRPIPWFPLLEWHPERLTRADLRHFDHVVVGGAEAVQRRAASHPDLVPLTQEGRWRLYQVARSQEGAP